jgi:hypothetical protein
MKCNLFSYAIDYGKFIRGYNKCSSFGNNSCFLPTPSNVVWMYDYNGYCLLLSSAIVLGVIYLLWKCFKKRKGEINDLRNKKWTLKR